MSRRNFVLGSAAAALLHALPVASRAAAYPEKAIHLVVAQSPGGGSDSIARMLAEKISRPLGQPVVVENRVGASGTIGTEYGARAAPDGYSLLLGIAATHASGPNYFKKVNYDPIRDFAPITLVGTTPFILLVNGNLPFRTVPELVGYAKKNPGKLSFTSIGDGSPHRFAGELLKQAAGIDMVHVPAKGAAPGLNDLLGGHVDMFFIDPFSARSALATGRVRALASTSRERSAAMPDVPTLTELGYPIEHVGWYGMFAPAGTPRTIVERLNAEMVKAIRSPEMTELLTKLGTHPSPTTPEEFAAFVKRDYDRWTKLTQTSGVERQ
ncbi:MAG: Bug family tripartite tricarboxylate transporter substrate binding protein [Cupriavidus necator]